jgi:hypothetical protein
MNPWKTQDAVAFDSYEIVGSTLTVNLDWYYQNRWSM